MAPGRPRVTFATLRTEVITKSQSLLARRDLGVAAALALMLPLSWLAPERLWQPISRAAARTVMRCNPRLTAARIGRVRRSIGGRSGLPDPRAIVSAVLAARMEQYLQYLREHRPGGWHPRIELSGREHIDGALESGSGCILWVAPFAFSFLVSKKALHLAGYPPIHLSEQYHGGARSKLGTRYLNPVTVRVESRYLAERIATTEETRIAQTRKLQKALRANRPVSISCSWQGVRTVAAPLLGGALPVATGAVSLALATGAPLLPLIVLRRGPGRFEVLIEAPLELAQGLDRHAAVEETTRRFVRRIEALAVEHPLLLSTWHRLQGDRSSAAVHRSQEAER